MRKLPLALLVIALHHVGCAADESDTLPAADCDKATGQTACDGPSTHAEFVAGVVSKYKIDESLYPPARQNSWHFVTITWDEEKSEFTWRNRANRQWSLHPIEHDRDGGGAGPPKRLAVGRECPYFETGH